MKTTLKTLAAAGAFLALAACSEVQDGTNETVADQAATAMTSPLAQEPEIAAYGSAAATAGPQLAPLSQRPAIPVNLPRMAYVFDYGFRLPGANIADLQLRHADMCEAMGPYQCQIVGMTNTGGSDEYASGQLQLAVAADRARSFVRDLAGTLAASEGEQVRANITGEDLSKSLVDTEARLQSRVELRDRLLNVLRTRQGDIDDLVQAERSVAQINEEIDQARSWMEEMRGRVAFSRVNLSYESSTPVASNFLGPVRGAYESIGSILGTVLAIMIVLASAGVPAALAIWAIRKLTRQFRPVTAEG